jgi:hypothetical protein
MSRLHSTVIALLVGTAATVGLSAAVHTVRLGQKTPVPSVSPHDLASRQAKLAAWSRSLQATLAKRPPALPKLPHFAPVAAQPAAPPPPAETAQQHVTYVKAPTVVKYKHAPAQTSTTTTTTTTDDESDDDGSGDDGGHSGGGD